MKNIKQLALVLIVLFVISSLLSPVAFAVDSTASHSHSGSAFNGWKTTNIIYYRNYNAGSWYVPKVQYKIHTGYARYHGEDISFNNGYGVKKYYTYDSNVRVNDSTSAIYPAKVTKKGATYSNANYYATYLDLGHWFSWTFLAYCSVKI